MPRIGGEADYNDFSALTSNGNKKSPHVRVGLEQASIDWPGGRSLSASACLLFSPEQAPAEQNAGPKES